MAGIGQASAGAAHLRPQPAAAIRPACAARWSCRCRSARAGSAPGPRAGKSPRPASTGTPPRATARSDTTSSMAKGLSHPPCARRDIGAPPLTSHRQHGRGNPAAFAQEHVIGAAGGRRVITSTPIPCLFQRRRRTRRADRRLRRPSPEAARRSAPPATTARRCRQPAPRPGIPGRDQTGARAAHGRRPERTPAHSRRPDGQSEIDFGQAHPCPLRHPRWQIRWCSSLACRRGPAR